LFIRYAFTFYCLIEFSFCLTIRNSYSKTMYFDGEVNTSQSGHLIVLSHGLMGGPNDLSYLCKQLETLGGELTMVLSSNCNEFVKTTHGVSHGGRSLADEIKSFINTHDKDAKRRLKYISFVGNSLGGLYTRYAIKELFDEEKGTIAGLIPSHFMTVATPHLGVRDYTFLDEAGIFVPGAVKMAVANLFQTTGKDLFDDLSQKTSSSENDQDDIENDESNGLLFHMATSENFLRPLRSFRKRRLYANLQGDLVVPLGTAAFMDPQQVQQLRSQYGSTYGILTTITTTTTTTTTSSTSNIETMARTSTTISNDNTIITDSEELLTSYKQPTESTSSTTTSTTRSESSKGTFDCVRDNNPLGAFSILGSFAQSLEGDVKESQREAELSMRAQLDSVGWEKVLVNFRDVLPLSHNKICALTKYPKWLNSFLGFEEGQFVMNNAANWILDRVE